MKKWEIKLICTDRDIPVKFIIEQRDVPNSDDVLKISTFNGYNNVSEFEVVELVEFEKYIPPYVSFWKRWITMNEDEREQCQKDLIKALYDK